ncbi:MAG: acetyl-CoA carboxylase biotin carboxyl carrier protein subunit [Bacteroidetes bacterium]|jgi:biotin carboxyl carrier protein|nr:acetyl-CoA carboxylase biotin carboxyl carrier protein subunit [Bacteroidota bacterium]MBT4400104.1 acetyl-CoA carboxylase biotin carboxyl carrier protein subunit [Bacteroidota bacterium]MBT4411413.1 acetyl-CoA carboxylase biotin carboxyl carrier protein subunit [Bacteroidota bacterium]MBT5425954.1 acetyl-CoA carboxylase biotin carboxyl carrier protein subunit [Bacteroidota bacterium]MBT7095412.1 acetyl-CoA carboxylase biotin carboxyl carrier protein subunit [Bacteroidota bacterium]
MTSKKDNNQHFHYFNVEGTRYRTALTKKFTERKPWVPNDPNMITSPIPGTVAKMCVKVGQKVSEGKCLYILEAMKMKNRINSPKAGIVSKILVEEGVIVPRAELLIELSDLPEKTKTRSKSSKTRQK